MNPTRIEKIRRLAREGSTPGERAAAQAALDRIRDSEREVFHSSSPGVHVWWTDASVTASGAVTISDLSAVFADSMGGTRG